MRKSRRRSRHEVTDRSAITDVVSQLECAVRYPQATLIGALVGGLVPWFARSLAHDQLPAAWSADSRGLAIVMLAVVLGGSLFSALSVYKFGRATFGDARKAVGFALAIEGVMLVASGATSAVALVVLIVINALANGSSIALSRAATCKKREANDRRAATRRRRTATTPRPTPATSPSPIPVVDGPMSSSHPAPRTPSRSPVRWELRLDDAIDAEIVSEQKLLALS